MKILRVDIVASVEWGDMEIVAGVFGSGLEGREGKWGELRSPLRRAPDLHLQLLCLVTQPLEVSYIKRIR